MNTPSGFVIAINIAKSVSHASLADGVIVTAGGVLTVKTSANTDASAKADGKATEAGTVGIGVGVAVNKVDLTNLASIGNTTVHSNGLDVEAGMTVNGVDHIQRFDGTAWTTIDAGDSFPEQPSDGDFFQLTKAAPAQTTVNGASQTLGSSLTETMYVIDEPTVGLHARDSERLLSGGR